MPGRPNSAASRMLSPFWAQARPKCGAKCGLVLGAPWRLRCNPHLHRQPDLATVKCMSAAINELYEPGSSADRVDAWDFLKDLAARSTAMGPISSRLVDSKRLGKLDRQYLEAAVLSMSGRRGLVVGCSRDGPKQQVLRDRVVCEAPRGAATARLQLTWLQPSRLSRRSLFARDAGGAA